MNAYSTIGLYLAALVGLCDQLSKVWILQHLSEGAGKIVVNAYLNLTLVMNNGMIFGLLGSDAALSRYLFVGAAGIILLFLLGWLRRAENLSVALGLGFVIGGAFGNVIDRLSRGAVVDFIDLHLKDHHWYTFNLADAAIDVGVALLVLDQLVRTYKRG